MAITFELVSRGSNHVVYLANSTGSTLTEQGIIQFTGAGAADVALEDAANPPDGEYNAGAMLELVRLPITSKQQADRTYMDLGLAPGVGDGIANVQGKRMRAWVQPLTGNVLKNWAISANFSAGRGQYVVQAGQTGAQEALVIIELIGTPQQF